jgi:hypothetical protein
MDDLVDVRPRVGQVLTWFYDQHVAGYLRRWLGMKPEPWFDGQEGLSVSSFVTRCTYTHVDPRTTERLVSAARAHGVSMQGILNSATAMAVAIASDEPLHKPLTLKNGTPFSTRRLCTDKPPQLQHPGAANRLVTDEIGNYVAMPFELLRFPAVAAISETGGATTTREVELFELARGYLARFRAVEKDAVTIQGLYGLVLDARVSVPAVAATLRNRRTYSTVVSNLGLVGTSASASGSSSSALTSCPLPEPESFQLLDMLFGQSVAVPHGLWVHNAVTSVRGGLNIVSCSVKELVSDKQADTFQRAFEEALRRVTRGDKVEYTALARQMRQTEASPSAW